MTVSRSKAGETNEQEFQKLCRAFGFLCWKQYIPSRYVFGKKKMTLISIGQAPCDFIIIDNYSTRACLVELKSLSKPINLTAGKLSKQQQQFFRDYAESPISLVLFVKIADRWKFKTAKEVVKMIDCKISIKHSECTSFLVEIKRLRKLL